MQLDMHALSTRRQLLHAAGGAGVTALATLAGCTVTSDYDHTGSDAPRFDAAHIKPARVAWVLSSGGPRGFVHVGVLKALNELQLKPDLVVGGSVGALVGALYACGMPVAQMEVMSLELGLMDMGRLAVGGEARFNGGPIAEFINRELRGLPIEQLKTRFAAAVVERNSRKALLFNAGNAGLAVQASSAIEGTMTPVRIRGMQFVDADLATPMPVRLARGLGALRVLAVDASAHEDKAPAGTERYRAGDLRKRALTQADTKEANMTLHPDFGYYVNASREFRLRAIRAGYEHTLAHAQELRALHAAHSLT